MDSNEEQFYFERFISQSFDQPIKWWRPDRPDQGPDFLVELNDKVIGVELTEFVINDKVRENFEFRRGIVLGAEAHYKKLVSDEIKGSLYIDLKHDINLKNSTHSKEKLYENIALFVINEFNNIEETQESTYKQLKKYNLNEYIYSIELRTDAFYKDLIWWEPSEMFRAGDISHVSVLQKIKDFIDKKKEGKANAYKQYCDECWLLVIAVRGNYSPISIPSGDLSDVERIANDLFAQSGFDNILLFDSARIAKLK